MDASNRYSALESGQSPDAGISPSPGTDERRRADKPREDMQQALRQAQENLLRYQELFDFAPVGYLVTDAQGIIQEANYAAAAMLGARRQFLVGTPLLFFIAESDRHSFSVNLLELRIASGRQKQWTLKLCPPRADPLYVVATVAAAPAHGAPDILRWTFRDITRQHQIEEVLRAEKEFTDILIELAEAAVLVLDPTGRILRTNRYLYALTGHEPDDLKGSLLIDLLLPEEQRTFEQELSTFGAGDPNAHGVFRLRSSDQRVHTIAWAARTLTATRGKEAKTLIVGNDITELQEAQRRAVQVERLAAIGEMSAGLAHESRNALQRSMAALALLAFRVQDKPELMALVERVQKAQDDLHRQYESVREYAAPIKLEREVCDLARLWREAWENLALARKGREAELYAEINVADLECEVSPHHIRQVFRNLLENALSATEKPIRICIRCTAAEFNGRAAIQIAVQDNGPGFSPEDRAMAFKLFFTTKVRGTGLGLSICKRLVEAHGGRIALGEANVPGAVIVVTLPRRRS